MGRFGRVLSIVAVACAVMGAYNVYVNDPNLEGVAREKSCEGNRANCRSRLLRLRRSPFTQAYVFTTGAAEVQVDCTRSFLLIGSYQCTRQSTIKFVGAHVRASGVDVDAEFEIGRRDGLIRDQVVITLMIASIPV